jgi:hypothetical protein
MNDTVDVTIRLKGDGYELQPDPIDVVLCTDRSGSMLKDYPDRMVKAMEASEIFNAQMNYPHDHLGLISFGKKGQTNLIGYGYRYWLGQDNTYGDDYDYRSDHYPGDPKYYADYATLDLPVSDNAAVINTTIRGMVPDWGTPMRSGIYKAIKELNVNGSADAVKAVIVLSDGDYNHYGDPLARGTAIKKDPSAFGDLTETYLPFDGLGTGRTSNQNMSVFAMSNDIRIYSIAFANDISDEGKNTLRVLAESTGGKYYHAPTGDDLAQVYTDIAGELKTEAGVNTTMNLEFGTVSVNSTLTGDVFEYEHLDPVSTRMTKYWTDNKTTIWGPVCENQGTDWQGDKILSFDVGDIYLNQTWETTFRLKVLKEGNIDIFGDGSVIRFNGTEGESEVGLPHTFITARLNLTETDVSAAQIELEWQSVDIPEDKPGVLTPYWNLSYTGNRSVTQKILYQFSPDDIFWSGTWHEADTLYHPPDTNINGTYSTTLNLGEKEGWYKIRVFAQEITPDDDGASDEITWNDPVEVGTSDRAYIRIS